MVVARPHPAQTGDRGLIEREEPLAALRRYLDEAAGGAGRLVVIRGEAGIGKTALVRAFVESCPAGVTVMTGASDGVSTPQPFGPLEDMAVALGPELRRILDSDASRAQVGRWLLGRLSGGGTQIIVIEDIQWADDATLEVVAYLARRLGDLPVLVLLPVRDDEGAATGATRILGSIATLPVVRQLTLAPLSRAAVGRLARRSGMDVDELHRITAGNPFYVSEVLDAGDGQIPLSVMDAVRARVARLDQRAVRALESAAIIGVRAEPWLLAAIAGEWSCSTTFP